MWSRVCGSNVVNNNIAKVPSSEQIPFYAISPVDKPTFCLVT